MAALLSSLFASRGARARARVAALRAEMDAGGPDAARTRALGDALEVAGDLLEAISVLTDANRLSPDPTLERRLIRLRRRAFARIAGGVVPPWPAGTPSGAPTAPPEPIAADDLTAAALRAGIRRQGCLWVRGLVPPKRIVSLVEAIDRAFAAREAVLARRATVEDRQWYDPVERVPKDASRHWVRLGQGLLAADSPRAFFEFMEMVHEVDLDRIIADYLGERPALSVEKCTLRRADASLHQSTWHQDGAFLGRDIRTVDAWFALSRCGRDAPGLDVVPLRLERILPTGEKGTFFEWTVSPETVARELPQAPVWRPEFEPGDALLFDHLLLHKTAAEPDMPNVRYAIESWFFAPSVYPRGSTPLVV